MNVHNDILKGISLQGQQFCYLVTLGWEIGYILELHERRSAAVFRNYWFVITKLREPDFLSFKEY